MLAAFDTNCKEYMPLAFVYAMLCIYYMTFLLFCLFLLLNFLLLMHFLVVFVYFLADTFSPLSSLTIMYGVDCNSANCSAEICVSLKDIPK